MTLVGKDIDGAESLEGNLDLLLSVTILLEDNAAEDDQTVDGNVLVQLQLLTCRRDSRNYGLARLTRLNRLSTRQLLRQKLHMLINRVACGYVQRHERGSVSIAEERKR